MSRSDLQSAKPVEGVRPRRLLRRVEDCLRYVIVWLFGLLVLCVVIGIPVMLAVTSMHGLGEGARRILERKLSGRYYSVSMERVLFSPTHGFIIDRLEIHDTSPLHRLIASASAITVSFNLEAMLRKEIRLERIALRDASLDIPLGIGEEPRMRLDHVQGDVLCSKDLFTLSSASFRIAGIDVLLSGNFRNPNLFSPKPVSQKGPGNTALMIDTIQRELESVRWESGAPVLTVQASGDLESSESLRVDHATFQAGSAVWRGVKIRQLMLDLQYGERVLTLQKAFVDDGSGCLHATGKVDFSSNRASLEFAGSFDAGVLPPLIFPAARASDWTMIDPVRLSGEFTTGLQDASTLVGQARIESGRFHYRGVSLDSLSGGISVRGGRILVRDFHAQGDPGTLDADLMIAPGDNRLKLNASLLPAKMVSAFSGKTAEALASMDSEDPLTISFNGWAPGTDPLQFTGSGTLSLGKATMRGSPITGLSSRFGIGGGVVDFRNILVSMGSGTGSGEFLFDYRNWEGRFSKVNTTLDPVKLMLWIDPKIAEGLKPYRFNTPPETRLSGKVGLRDPRLNALHITFNAPSGLCYKLLGKDLSFGKTSGWVDLKSQDVVVEIPDSSLFGGAVAVRVNASVAPGDTRYGAKTHLKDVDLSSVTSLYFGYGSSHGKLTADYEFRAVGGDDRSMIGKGNLLIKNGRIIEMPILGPLSALLNDIIPGFGYEPARRATADFTVAAGVINTPDLLIQGAGFSMIGYGDIHYLEDWMDLNVRLNAQGLPGVVLFPVSKILEYETISSPKHPNWRPKILPRLGPSSAPAPSPTPVFPGT